MPFATKNCQNVWALTVDWFIVVPFFLDLSFHIVDTHPYNFLKLCFGFDFSSYLSLDCPNILLLPFKVSLHARNHLFVESNTFISLWYHRTGCPWVLIERSHRVMIYECLWHCSSLRTRIYITNNYSSCVRSTKRFISGFDLSSTGAFFCKSVRAWILFEAKYRCFPLPWSKPIHHDRHRTLSSRPLLR